MNKTTRLTFGSLFAGIGGFDLGFERAGMVCKWQVEIDGYCQRVLEKHRPAVRRWGDVRTWPQPDTERVDIICGGFPCQDISSAGRKAGITGAKSGLWLEYRRIIGEVKPSVVVVENSAGLVSRGLQTVLQDFADLGFDAGWRVLCSSEFGFPFMRRRLFLVACPHGNSEPIGALHAKVAGVSTASRDHWRRTLQAVASDPRVDDGVSHRVRRLRATGNAVIPQMAEWVGRQILAANVHGITSRGT